MGLLFWKKIDISLVRKKFSQWRCLLYCRCVVPFEDIRPARAQFLAEIKNMFQKKSS